MRRQRVAREPPRAWTPEEDAALAEMVTLGLCSTFYHLSLPGRTFGEIATRRLELKIPPARLI